MELWVRSQNKKTLAKVDNLNIDKDDYSIYSQKQTYQIIFGTYKSKERALEILDEIQKKINLMNLGHDFGSPMIDLDNPTYIYQMPEE